MSKQPAFSKWAPVAIMVGVLAGLSVLASLQLGAKYGAWISAPWVMFISWGLYFLAGAKPSRMNKYVIGLTGGIAFAIVTLLVADYLGGIVGSVFALPVTVFFAATTIVMLELTDWFELAPAYFLTYAGFFAYYFGNFGGGMEVSMYQQAAYYWVLTIVGLALGYVSATLKTSIFDAEHVPMEERATVFDKE